MKRVGERVGRFVLLEHLGTGGMGDVFAGRDERLDREVAIKAIRPEHLARAFRLLGANDAVFGAAGDGGYWLVGLKRAPRVRQIFRNVRWSTVHALADTQANLAGRRVGRAAEISDVDGAEDYRRHGGAGARVVCPPWQR